MCRILKKNGTEYCRKKNSCDIVWQEGCPFENDYDCYFKKIKADIGRNVVKFLNVKIGSKFELNLY